MSIFKNAMKALGFSGEDDELDLPYTAENITNACAPEPEKTESVEESQPDKTIAQGSTDPQLPDSLLEIIVEILNRSLPDYVVASIDKEAEKKYLYQQLGAPFKKFVEEANSHARTQMSQKWKNEQENLKKELEATRAKLKELEEQRNAMQSAQLSAERQKRAVTEKMHELEARIATMEAEREQFELENKSLVNKLKVANVHQDELDNSREEHTRLMAEVNKQKVRIAELEQQQADIQKLNEELEQLRHDIEQSEPQENEAEKQLAVAQQNLEQQRNTIEQLTQQLQEVQAQLAQAQAASITIAEIEAKCQKAEQEILSKKSETETLVAKLKAQEDANQELQARIEELLAQQQEAQVLAQANTDKATSQEVEALKGELEQAHTMLAALRNQRQELLAQIDDLKQAQAAPLPVVEKTIETPVEKKPAAQETPDISFVKAEEATPQAKTPKETPAVKPVVETPKAPVVSEPEVAEDSVFGGFDDFDDNWLIPTRPDTPEMIAKRKEEERRKQEEEERLAAEQKKSTQVDSSQMTLW